MCHNIEEKPSFQFLLYITIEDILTYQSAHFPFVLCRLKLTSLVYKVLYTRHQPYLTDLSQYRKSARSTRSSASRCSATHLALALFAWPLRQKYCNSLPFTSANRWPDDFQCSVTSAVWPFSQHGNVYTTLTDALVKSDTSEVYRYYALYDVTSWFIIHENCSFLLYLSTANVFEQQMCSAIVCGSGRSRNLLRCQIVGFLSQSTSKHYAPFSDFGQFI